MKNAILLITGAVITFLFLLFAIPLFEGMYYEREFSNEMFNENVYLMISVVTVVINSVRFSRWYHWLVMLAIAAFVTPTINYIYADSIFTALDYDFTHQLWSFASVNLVVEVVLFVIASFSMRWWSTNCRHTPIPE